MTSGLGFIDNAHRSQAELMSVLGLLRRVLSAHVVPVGGTGLAAMRYGTYFGTLQRRINFVDADLDFVVLHEQPIAVERIGEILRESFPGVDIHSFSACFFGLF